MTDAEALARWREWARDFGEIDHREQWTDDDLRLFVISAQEQRAIRIISALRFNLKPSGPSEPI